MKARLGDVCLGMFAWGCLLGDVSLGMLAWESNVVGSELLSR